MGVDFGSKTAGTTAISYLDKNFKIKSLISEKGKDADTFILDAVGSKLSQLIFIDAPLSLPGVYRGISGYNDYFYRECDKNLNAMSPMFLGGLTARAMKLQGIFNDKDIQLYEVYPSEIAKELGLTQYGYKKEYNSIEFCIKILQKYLLFSITKIEIQVEVKNWHVFDSILALTSGIRFIKGLSKTYGNENEGLITV